MRVVKDLEVKHPVFVIAAVVGALVFGFEHVNIQNIYPGDAYAYDGVYAVNLTEGDCVFHHTPENVDISEERTIVEKTRIWNPADGCENLFEMKYWKDYFEQEKRNSETYEEQIILEEGIRHVENYNYYESRYLRYYHEENFAN